MQSFKRIFLLFTALLLVFSAFGTEVLANELGKPERSPSLDETHFEQYQNVQSQLDILTGEAQLGESLKDKEGNVNVIVHYREPSVGLQKGIVQSQGKKWSGLDAEKVRQKIEKQQRQAEHSMRDKNINFSKGNTYTTVLNAESMTVAAEDLDKLLEVEEVALVEEDHFVQLDPEIGTTHNENIEGASDVADEDIKPNYIAGITHLDIPKVWELGNRGQGVKVGVIDTGIDYNHPDLADVYKGGRNYVNGTDYLVERPSDDPYETKPEERPEGLPEYDDRGNSYWTTHGTHVAGTIAAQGSNDYGMIGVAPNVDIYAYRALGAYGSGYTSWIVGGIEGAVQDGMDVINLSLGNTLSDESQANSFALNNAMLLGTVAVAATGNSGPERSTVGGPATSTMAISVGNTTLPEQRVASNVTLEAGSFSQTLDANFMAFMIGTHPQESLEGTMEVVSVPGVGDAADFESVDVEGKVALIQRGAIAFVDKIANARSNGAKGVIIYNSADGTNAPGPVDIFLGTAFDYVPTLDISHTLGAEFAAAIGEAGTGSVTFNSFEDSLSAGDAVNDSSSRGPSTPNFDIKPDISAPGTNILSTIPGFVAGGDYSEAYAQYTGTSMATPHAAGVAALLIELHPEWTPFDIKSAMSNTAKVLDTALYDVFAQGAGLVQPYAAATTNTLIKVPHESTMDGETHSHTRGTMSFGFVSPGGSAQTVTKDLIIESNSGETYSFDVVTTKAPTGSMAGATLTPGTQSVTVNGTETVQFTLNVPAGVEEPGNEFLGYINVTSGSGTYSVPFAVGFAPPMQQGFAELYLNDYHMSPNGDGVQDETSVYAAFHNPQQLTAFSWFDLLNPSSGPNADGYIGDFAFVEGIESSITVPVNGEMYNIENGGYVYSEVPDGVYTIDAISQHEGGTELQYDGPLFVKRNVAQVVEPAVSGGIIRAGIEDLYIEVLPVLEEMYGMTYDPNTYISGTYQLSNGESTEEGAVAIGADGTLSLDFSGYTGAYHLTLDFTDAAGNSGTYVYTVNFDENTITEGEAELPEEEAPGSTAYELTSADIGDGITRNNIKDIHVTVPEASIEDGSASIRISNDLITQFAQMRKNKTVVLNVGGSAVQLTVQNFQQFTAYDAVEVDILRTPGTEVHHVSDIYEVLLRGITDDGTETITTLDSAMSVMIESPGRHFDVYDIAADTIVKSKYNKKQQVIQTTVPSSYVVVE
ncbi:S8 family serine peptidase [Salinicoccus cyprini]|uniref:S8 family serine peptidase n=1 Tax=Salinicoccus cyprini TaxID=2493691 RepID=A0A558AUA7_9STAP|nr:S8 family serine peptidase [Salinicoccus cyprini]TVT27845.1 S8 family serine peptidase [Salinicoccus cyprini]